MEGLKKDRMAKYGITIVAGIIAIIFLAPFYFIIVNSVKSLGDMLGDAAGWPQVFEWGNFRRAWEVMNFSSAFVNTFIITLFSNIGLIIISSMAAYRMVRHPSRSNNILFLMFIAAMVIPFQSIMIPLVKVAGEVGLMNSRIGIIISYFGFGVPLNLFLYHGFIKSIPKEVEESAIIDGCSPYGVFWRIVFPLLKPITITIVLLNTLWIWNDFLLPLIFLYDQNLKTIPLAIYALFGEHTKQWDLALAGLMMSMVPISIFFLFLQKQIVEGITAGSVKG